MRTTAHLWAVGYDNIGRAHQVRDEIAELGWGPSASKHLILVDLAVVVRHPDGSFTIDHGRSQKTGTVLGCTAAGFLTGLVLAVPFTAPAIAALVGGAAALVGGAGIATLGSIGISDDFIREVEGLMQPGTSALFVLAERGHLDAVLHRIQGLGGTVLQTNVDLELAHQIQSSLAATSPEPKQADRQ